MTDSITRDGTHKKNRIQIITNTGNNYTNLTLYITGVIAKAKLELKSRAYILNLL